MMTGRELRCHVNVVMYDNNEGKIWPVENIEAGMGYTFWGNWI